MSIHTKPPTKEYEQAYDRIFGKQKAVRGGKTSYRMNPDGSLVAYYGTPKHRSTVNIIPDNYDAKSFKTDNITGELVLIESRSQERRLMKENGAIKWESGMRKYDKRIRYPSNVTDNTESQFR